MAQGAGRSMARLASGSPYSRSAARRPLLHGEGVVGVVVGPVAVDEHREQHRRLVQGELPPDAGAFTGTGGLEGVRGAGLLRLGGEPGGVEQPGVVAPDGLPVQHRAEHGDRLSGEQRDPAAEQGVLAGVPAERGGRRPQSQRLVQHLTGVGQPPDLVERRVEVGLVSPQGVDLSLDELEDGRVLGQVVPTRISIGPLPEKRVA
ncbi:hypothetical protein IQ62_24790 [Streptomyces scabiei]|nr:hypothetical protein IQ62_24790 [Streptomyces scabiei]